MGILPPSLLSIVTKNQQISFVTVLELSCELKHQSTWRSGETKTTTILTDRSRRMETLAVMLCCPAHLRPMRELVCFHLHLRDTWAPMIQLYHLTTSGAFDSYATLRSSSQS